MNTTQDPEAVDTDQTTDVPAVDLPRLVRHIAGLREKAQKLEAQCCSQGDYEQYESRISSLLEEADELQSMILPNAALLPPYAGILP